MSDGEAGETILITGVPGFIGKRVASLALALTRAEEVVFLVQPRFREAAEAFAARERAAGAKARATILEGDIGTGGLGLGPAALASLRGRVTLALHLAAAYDLRLTREVGERVNVGGTRNVLDALEGAPRFKRLGYASTTAISGDRVGRFGEEDFDVGQTPKNEYEATKLRAEAVVRERWSRVPTVIYRPTVVVGDSRTGEAEKIDGPYYAMVMIDRGLHLVTARSSARFHLAPVDFVARAMVALLERDDAAGRVFHLADPAPVTFDEFFDLVCDAFGKRRPLLRVPAGLLRPLFRMPGVGWTTGVPRQSFAYTKIAVDYPCENTLRALAGTGIACPPFSSYVANLVRYYREHLSHEASRGPRW
ncbi:MAG: SDR family oxidoreductase [Planctomycetes bacterium]|nr:SDR family oxidoreductase [Planctomycetota bacterium]